MTRLVIITEIISPYRIPLFNSLAENSDVDLHVVFLAETDPAFASGRFTGTKSGSRIKCSRHRQESRSRL